MVFPNVDGVPRHPSQLYEFALEGVVLFTVLWWFSTRARPRGAVSGAFLLGLRHLAFWWIHARSRTTISAARAGTLDGAVAVTADGVAGRRR